MHSIERNDIPFNGITIISGMSVVKTARTADARPARTVGRT
jgi:hypothetical protein